MRAGPGDRFASRQPEDANIQEAADQRANNPNHKIEKPFLHNLNDPLASHHKQTILGSSTRANILPFTSITSVPYNPYVLSKGLSLRVIPVNLLYGNMSLVKGEYDNGTNRTNDKTKDESQNESQNESQSFLDQCRSPTP